MFYLTNLLVGVIGLFDWLSEAASSVAMEILLWMLNLSSYDSTAPLVKFPVDSCATPSSTGFALG